MFLTVLLACAPAPDLPSVPLQDIPDAVEPTPTLPDAPPHDTAAPLDCAPPTAPVLPWLHPDDLLVFPEGAETAVGDADFTPTRTVALTVDGPTRVRARFPGCDALFDHTYLVTTAFPIDDAIPADVPLAWATGHHYVPGDDVAPAWQTPDRALGAAGTSTTDVCPLGSGGTLQLTFDAILYDGPGPDLAVYENAFDDAYLELAHVEVSTDGLTFARFDSSSLTSDPVSGFASLDASAVAGLAGRYRVGLGTPFDLAWLRYHPAVLDGTVDLLRVHHVRLVDVPGDGEHHDSFGRPIYDPYPTVVTAGFDVDAVGLIHAATR